MFMSKEEFVSLFSSCQDEAALFYQHIVTRDQLISEMIGSEADIVRRYLLNQFPNLGRPPSFSEVAKELNLDAIELESILTRLDRMGMLAFILDSRKIVAAYPFCAYPTAQLVIIRGKKPVNCLHAVDALGVSSMFSVSTQVNAVCFNCKAPIKIKVFLDKAISVNFPDIQVGWENSTANERAEEADFCSAISFFCSPEHGKIWQAENGNKKKQLTDLATTTKIANQMFKDTLEVRQ
jgi:hypothetical protein